MSMPPDSRVEFYRELHAAFLAAGPPTYARLAAIMREHAFQDGRVIRRASALQDIMNGRCKTLPRRDVLSSVIHALRIHAKETGLDPERIGTTGDWHRRLHEASGHAADDGEVLV